MGVTQIGVPLSGSATILTITASTTFVVPAGCYLLDVTAIGGGAGGGGGGAGAYSNTSGQVPYMNGGGGGQGGASGYARRLPMAVVPGQIIPVVIGAGGVGGAGGASGTAAATTVANQGVNGSPGSTGGPGALTQFGGLIAHGAQANGVGTNGTYSGGAGGSGGQYVAGTSPSASTGGTNYGGVTGPSQPADYSQLSKTMTPGSAAYYVAAGAGGIGGDGTTGQGSGPYAAAQRWWLPTIYSGSTTLFHPDTTLAVEAYRAAGGPGGGGGPGYGFSGGGSAAGVWLITTGYSAGVGGSLNMGGAGGDLSVPSAQITSTAGGTLTAAQLALVNGATGGNASAPGGGGGGGAGGGVIRGAGTTGQTVTGTTGGAGGRGGDGVVILRWSVA